MRQQLKDQLRDWNAEDWRIVRFFPYETGAYSDNILCRSNADEESGEDVNSTLTQTFETLVKRAEEILGREVMDNKIAVEAINRETRETVFFGFYDYYFYAASAIRPREGWCRQPIEIEEA